MRRGARSTAAWLAGTLLATTALSGCFAEPSPLPTVRDFLVAWQNGHYTDAADQTDGDRAAVASALGTVPSQLDLASLRLSLGHVHSHGDNATAQFSVTIDLGDNGTPWNYGSQMRLHRKGDDWKVVWSPTIIHPSLGPGQRLALVTETPPRQPVQDNKGRTLLRRTRVQVLGVYPGRLNDTDATVTRLSKISKLDVDRVLGRVRSAPPQDFLPLVSLQMPQQAGEAAQLRGVPGVEVHNATMPVAPATAADLIGQVGPANAVRLQQVGSPYQPGDTIGVSGLQLLYQRRLAGTPTVKVVAQNPSGAGSQVLREWPGDLPSPVRTTLDRRVQNAAERALKGLRVPAALVAVQPTTGQILGVANQHAGGRDLAFEGHFPPGMTFAIPTTQALMQYGQKMNAKVACPPSTSVAGQTIRDYGRAGTTFQSNFAYGCATAFASLARTLSYKDLPASAAKFGIGVPWSLPVPSFSGSVPEPASGAERAAAMVGQGKVEVSPLNMALAVGSVSAGTWKPPTLLTEPRSAQTVPPRILDDTSPETLQTLMSLTVRKGAGRAAKLPGAPVSGITATVPGGNGHIYSWFAGYRASTNNLAFALVIDKKTDAAKIAAKFLRAAR